MILRSGVLYMYITMHCYGVLGKHSDRGKASSLQVVKQTRAVGNCNVI